MTPASYDLNGRQHSYLIKLDVRKPRLQHVGQGRVLANHPVNEEFEEQLSQPFYFQQKDHGTISGVLFAKKSESPEIAAFKKGREQSILPDFATVLVFQTVFDKITTVAPVFCSNFMSFKSSREDA